MDSIKEIWAFRNLWLCGSTFARVMLLSVVFVGKGHAATCIAPQKPFVPTDQYSVQRFREIILRDFETYIYDIQEYFRCLDNERARAFEEARDVSEDYRQFLERSEQ